MAERNRSDTMRIVAASDSFKGSLSSTRIAELLERAVRDILPDVECIACPLADGGEGSLEAVSRLSHGELVSVSAHDALMRPIDTEVFIDGDKAFVESASTCGLTLLGSDEQNPLAASSYGVGECIRFALSRGCTSVAVGLGGTSVNDGGMGCLRALGIRFFDADGSELMGRGCDLGAVASVDESGLDPRVRTATITVLSDVTNPLLGPQGATRVFGPQKGASEADIEALESGMTRFSQVVAASHPAVSFETPGFGAAGGLGMALPVFLGARIRPGIDELLDLMDFDALIADADLVVTGEGRLDSQSLQGKAISGVVARAHGSNVPVAAICGTVSLDENALRGLGLLNVIDASYGQPVGVAMKHAEENYLIAAKELLGLLQADSS